MKFEEYYDWDAEARLQDERDAESFERYLQHLEEEDAYERATDQDDPRGA